jgi:hypothetical protein
MMVFYVLICECNLVYFFMKFDASFVEYLYVISLDMTCLNIDHYINRDKN